MTNDHARAIPLPAEDVVTERGLTIAVVTLDPHSPSIINIGWLPELFAYHPLPAAVREAIAARLRADADRLESGELEQRMKSFANINDMSAEADA
jgi:hypothetical protein